MIININFSMILGALKKHSNNDSFLYIIFYIANVSLQATDIPNVDSSMCFEASFDTQSLYNIYNNKGSCERYFLNEGIFEDLRHVKATPFQQNTVFTDTDLANKQEVTNYKHTACCNYNYFTIPPVSLECPEDIFDDDTYNVSSCLKRKRKLQADECNDLTDTTTYLFDREFIEISDSIDNSKNKIKKGRIDTKEEKNTVRSEYQHSNPQIVWKTNNTSTIGSEMCRSALIDASEPISITLDTNGDTKVKKPMFLNKRNRTRVTESPTKIQEINTENTIESSNDTESITLSANPQKTKKFTESEAESGESAYTYEKGVFIPYINDENHTIPANEDLNYNRSFKFNYKRRGETRTHDLNGEEQGKTDNYPIITVVSILHENNDFKITCFIKNIPRYLEPSFVKKINLMTSNIKYTTQRCTLLYKIEVTYTIPRVIKIKLKNLIPNLKYTSHTNIWEVYYEKTILSWRYRLPINIQNTISYNNELNKHINIQPEKRYKTKTIRSFIGINNFNKHAKRLKYLVNPILMEILNKLSLFHTHLVYFNTLKHSQNKLQVAIEEIENFRKKFITGILTPVTGVKLNNAELELVIVYELLYHNYNKASASILNTYDIYRLNGDDHHSK